MMTLIIDLLMMGRTFMTFSVVGILESVHIADMASSFASHAVQAVRFPFPANGEVTLHPVKARNAGRPPHLASPSAWAMAVASRYRNGWFASGSTKCEPETVANNLLRHTNAYNYNICFNSSEKNLVLPMFSSICGMHGHPSVRLFVCTTHQPCNVTIRGRR